MTTSILHDQSTWSDSNDSTLQVEVPSCVENQPALRLRCARTAERSQALSLLFQESSPRRRESTFRWARGLLRTNAQAMAGLYVAERDGLIRGTTWARAVAGRQMDVILPVLAHGEPASTRTDLLAALDIFIACSGTQIAYVSLRNKQRDAFESVINGGFHYITILARMECQLSEWPKQHSFLDGLSFHCCRSEDADRLKAVIERTTENSLDCPALRGLRPINDVLAGYINKADYEPSHWRIVRSRQRDVGCVLVSRHQQRPECEVVYLGLVPEARGRGWGSHIIRHAQFLAHSTGSKQLLLGCDANNPPALSTYLRAGFREIDRWLIFAKVSELCKRTKCREEL